MSFIKKKHQYMASHKEPDWRADFVDYISLKKPLHPYIIVHILHTVLYTFPKVLTRRICLTIKSILGSKGVTKLPGKFYFVLFMEIYFP